MRLRDFPDVALVRPCQIGRGEASLRERRRLMNAVKLAVWVILPIVGLVLVGMLAIWAIHVVLSLLPYIIVGGLVVGVGAYLYRRAKRAVGSGSSGRRRIGA
jgi:hypothetical protein